MLNALEQFLRKGSLLPRPHKADDEFSLKHFNDKLILVHN